VIVVHGWVRPAGSSVNRVAVRVKVVKDPPYYGSLAEVPTMPTDMDMDPYRETHPGDTGEWSVDDAGPVKCTAAGHHNQVVVWAFNPGEQVAHTALVNILIKCLPREAAEENAQAAGFADVTVTIPASGAVHPVNNTPGTSSGIINATGSVVGPSNTPVSLIVVPGQPYIKETIPPFPILGSSRVYTSANGSWSCGTVRGAACTSSLPYAQDQLLVWAYVNGAYSAELRNFKGRCMN